MDRMLTPEEVRLAVSGQMIPAIKSIRARTGAGLRDSKLSAERYLDVMPATKTLTLKDLDAVRAADDECRDLETKRHAAYETYTAADDALWAAQDRRVELLSRLGVQVGS